MWAGDRPVAAARVWHLAATGAEPDDVDGPGGPGGLGDPARVEVPVDLPEPQPQRYFGDDGSWGYGRATEWRMVSGGSVPVAARCQTRAVATGRSPAHMVASLSCVRLPGRTSRVSTRSAVRGTGPRKSMLIRATRIAGRPNASSRQVASSAVGGPPCWAAVSHGLVVASVGSKRPSPSGR
jgi:hypothetical protein